MTELRRIATIGRGAQIRLLSNDPGTALRDGHRLILLMQRLPSVIKVRLPVEEIDLGNPSACLLTDGGGYLFQPDAERPHGRAAVLEIDVERRDDELGQAEQAEGEREGQKQRIAGAAPEAQEEQARQEEA